MVPPLLIWSYLYSHYTSTHFEVKSPYFIYSCKLLDYRAPCIWLPLYVNWFSNVMIGHAMSPNVTMLNWKIFGDLWWYDMVTFGDIWMVYIFYLLQRLTIFCDKTMSFIKKCHEFLQYLTNLFREVINTLRRVANYVRVVWHNPILASVVDSYCSPEIRVYSWSWKIHGVRYTR